MRDPALLARLHPAPPAVLPCRICGTPADAFDIVDFNKFCSHEDFYAHGFSGVTVMYHRCRQCRCIFTDFFDDWDSAAFSTHVYNDYYHEVDGEYASVRPLASARAMAAQWGRSHTARVLDYGSGAGVFSAELRRLGYQHVQDYDPFSSPARPQGVFDLITCFEVIEHSPDPVATVADMASLLAEDGCAIVSQTLQPPDIGTLRGNWWYLGPRNGHICTFTPDAMALLAQSAGLSFHGGPGPYGFSRPRLSAHARRALAGVGPVHHVALLSAPPARPPAGEPVDLRPAWHEIEQGPRGPFRWSGAPLLHFPALTVSHVPATVRVVLPLLDRIAPTVLTGLTARCGTAQAPFKPEGDTMVAELKVLRPASGIDVLTGPLTRPADTDPPADRRLLGLAVAVLPGPTRLRTPFG